MPANLIKAVRTFTLKIYNPSPIQSTLLTVFFICAKFANQIPAQRDTSALALLDAGDISLTIHLSVFLFITTIWQNRNDILNYEIKY